MRSATQSATQSFSAAHMTPGFCVYDGAGGVIRRTSTRRFQRGVVTVSLPCRLKILLTRFNESLYQNAGRGQHLARTHPIRHSTARFGNGSRRVRCQRRNFTIAWQRPATAPKGAAYGCQPSFSAAFTFSASEPRFGLSIILYSSTSICLSWKNAGSESSRIYCLREAVCNFTPESQRIPPRFVLSAARAVQPSGQ